MRKFLLALLIVLWAAPAWAQFTLIAADEEDCASATTCVHGTGVDANAGDLIVAKLAVRNGINFTSIADGTNTYTCPAGLSLNDGTSNTTLCYVLSAADATVTPTYTIASASAAYARVEVWRPTGTAGFDTGSELSQASATSHNGTSISTAATTQLVAMAASHGGSAAGCASTSGMTVQVVNRGCFGYDITSVSSASHDGAYTISSATSAVVVLAAFTDTGGGGGGSCNGGMLLMGAGKACED